jgi:hypothetical protein
LRRNNEFVGLHGTSEQPTQFTIEELLAELEKVNMLDLGSNKNVGRGSILTWKGEATRMCGEFGAGWLVYGSYHIGKI